MAHGTIKKRYVMVEGGMSYAGGLWEHERPGGVSPEDYIIPHSPAAEDLSGLVASSAQEGRQVRQPLPMFSETATFWAPSPEDPSRIVEWEAARYDDRTFTRPLDLSGEDI